MKQTELNACCNCIYIVCVKTYYDRDDT